MIQLNRGVKQIIAIFLVLLTSLMGTGCDVNSMLSMSQGNFKVYNNGEVISNISYKDMKITDTKTEEKIAKVGTYNQLLSILYSMNYIWDPSRKAGGQDDIVSSSDEAGFDKGYSETNTQVSGVDEADIIKTDGNYIYYLYDGELYIFDISKELPDLVCRTKVSDDNRALYNMYISGDTLVLCGSKYEVFNNRLDSSKSYGDYDFDSDYLRHSFTVYAVYDISNRNSPSLKRLVEIEGDEISSRLIGDNLYFVTNKSIYPVFDSKVNDYEILPMYRDTASSKVAKVIQPDDIWYFPGSKEAQYLLVGTLDITKDDVVVPQAYLGSGEDIYMNTNSLYISKEVDQPRSQHDVSSSEAVEFFLSTEIYRFAIDGMDIEFVGNAKVDGSLINQYSMDEYNGILRVATGTYTDGNGVTTIDVNTMKPIASISGLAVGERIYSVRFIRDVGYMVTYRNVDPLFVFDLSNPEKPLKTGELKIPGFSQYLHPVGTQYLVGFGRNTEEKFDTDENGEKVSTGEVTDLGFKLSLFDVSDLYNPKEVFVKNYSEGSNSPAGHYPRSIMVDAKNNIFAFPIIEDDRYDNRKTGTIVKIDPSSGLTTLADVKGYTYEIFDARFCYGNGKLYFLADGSITVYSYPECEFIDSTFFY
jgi:uncharacterized secreted protein with C-terminal beta-propeller domain